ncbi:unnamed protein product, partial [Closterium sp. NIES-53]
VEQRAQQHVAAAQQWRQTEASLQASLHKVKLEGQWLQSQADTLRAHLARHQAVQQQMESSWQQLRGSTDTISALLRCNTTAADNPAGLGGSHGTDDDDDDG